MAAVFIVFTLLAMAYISATPFRTAGCLLSRQTNVVQQDIGAPDERQHTNYIRYLATQKSFPVFDPDSPDLYESYQSHQPPLYYLLATPLEMMFGSSEISEMWALRFLNTVLGALLIWGVFVGLRRMTGDGSVGFAAAAITAFSPTFLALSTSVSNDMLLYLIAVAIMNVLAQGWEIGWPRKRMAFLGLLLGLGVLTKTTAIVFIPVAAVALFLKPDRKPVLKDVLISAGVLVIACLPWLVRNQTLYGDPLAIGAFQKASVGNLATSVAIERAGGAGAYWFSNVFPLAADSYWAVFGYFDIFFQPATYYVIHAVALVLFGAFVWAVVSKTVSRRVAMILLLLLAMVLAGFISYNSNYFQAQGRYLYPAVFAISGMLAIGLRRIADNERNTLIGSGTIATGLICLNIYATMVLLPAAFELMQQCVSSTP